MKIKNLLLFTLLLTLLSSCNKDGELFKRDYRVSSFEYLTTYSNYAERVDIIYDDDKISQINIDGYPFNIGVDIKIVYTYNGDEVVLEWHENLENEWELLEKAVYKFENDQIIELVSYQIQEDVEQEIDRLLFEYTDGHLTQVTNRMLIQSNTHNIERSVVWNYSYKDGIVDECICKMDSQKAWEEMEKIKFTYDDDKLSFVDIYDKGSLGQSWTEKTQYEYTYTDDLLTDLIYRHYNDLEESWYGGNSYLFTYDDDNNLIESSKIGETSSYSYEEGSGNMSMFMYDIYLTDIPTPKAQVQSKIKEFFKRISHK